MSLSDRFIEVQGNQVTVKGIGKPKTIQVPEEVARFVEDNVAVIQDIISDPKFRRRLAHPGAFRSLFLLLYSRSIGVAPYKIARRYGVAPEQLYRIERALKWDGLYERVMSGLKRG